jgi:hypothetical protein
MYPVAPCEGIFYMGAQVNISSVLEDCATSHNRLKTLENVRSITALF